MREVRTSQCTTTLASITDRNYTNDSALKTPAQHCSVASWPMIVNEENNSDIIISGSTIKYSSLGVFVKLFPVNEYN